MRADAEPAEVVQPGEGPLYNPAHAAESRAVLAAAPRDPRLRAAAPRLPTVFVVVVAAIGDHPVRSLARPTAFARDRADPVDQWERLCDAIAMASGQRCGQRHAVTVDAQWCLEPVRARSTGERPVSGPPRKARMWLASTTPTDQSSRPRALSRLSISRCSRSHTPAACQSRSRRHAVTPEQPISRGSTRHGTPVTSTKRMAGNASSTRGRPIR
jgi:hypothetical protein